MNIIEEEQLKMEIAHIFESGANEIRIFEMVKSFIDSRKLESNTEIIGNVSDFYYLKNGDEILKGDEYLDIERGEVWLVTGQVGKKYRSGYHYKHRRKI